MPELRGEHAHAVYQLDHALEVAPHLSPVVAFQEAQAIAREVAHGCQGLVQLVRDAGRQLADHGQLAGLHQAALGLPQLGFCTLPLGDLLLQGFVGGLKVGRANLDLPFQVGVGRCQPVCCRPQCLVVAVT